MMVMLESVRVAQNHRFSGIEVGQALSPAVPLHYFSVRTKATTSAACFSVTPETGFIFPCPLRMTCLQLVVGLGLHFLGGQRGLRDVVHLGDGGLAFSIRTVTGRAFCGVDLLAFRSAGPGESGDGDETRVLR